MPSISAAGMLPKTSAVAAPARQSAPTAMTMLRSIAGRLDDRRGAIGHDLAHRLSHLGGIETHHDDGIRTHRGRVAHHAVDGLAPRLFEQLRVFVDLAADPARAHHDAEDLAESPDGPVTGHILRCRHDHGFASSRTFRLFEKQSKKIKRLI